MTLPQLTKLNSINGDRSEKNKIINDVVNPEEDRDAVNKKWVSDNFQAK